ncbi:MULTISPECIES: SGNH/GDSL hydrolase family protein [Lysinibacillus]|uniref:SGNH/GDSL hydrolase family protein n=1 Tax=Lysinibacillus TaxID=400634 RepID=UPI002AD2B195|nr:GDSL-type esterase/lipase family protein [Lysinibacillus irui]MEA0565431.1 GDSL-type esterase/lipase family protein [Lysinibacillus irui]
MKRLWSFIGVTILAMTCWASSAYAQTESYIAIGDSLAAGQTPYQEIDAGYSDLIAMKLSSMGQLSFYTKELAFPGFTTADVLERIQSEESKHLLENATLITVSAGANDLLRLVKVNPTAGTLAFSQLQTDSTLNLARKNMITILDELNELAPKAKIFVMGYYFAYPYVHPTQKKGTNEQLVKLNTILQQQAEDAGAVYVDVYDRFGLDAINYLPNSADVHPNFEGYRQMANAFLQSYSGSNALTISSSELPKPNPLSFEEIIKQQLSAKSKERETTQRQSTRTAYAIQGFPGYKAFIENI